MMIIKAFIPKTGCKEQYIGRPFLNEKHENIGSIVNCEEDGDLFELTIDAELKISETPRISFSIKSI